ncbi:hypothetical protein Pcaca04_00470 [Pectobacterium carotovorum subsp. carotovorum]|nr:hypothetical protein Pcaca04_00470 [Pectobacterium carotovorum subsp. carotovorum]
MSKEGFNTNDIDSIVARCSKRRHIDESNLKRKTLETGALPMMRVLLSYRLLLLF